MQEEYRSDLKTLSDLAGDYVVDYLDAFTALNPDASVAEVRDSAIQALKDAVGSYGPQAAEVTSELFETVARGEGYDVSGEIYETTDYEMVMDKVHYLAGKLIDNDRAGFSKSINDLAKFYIQREAFENMVRNCEDNEIRWARVPTGHETCAFCFMLASRGFEYLTRDTAEQRHSKHVHCDCIAVPGKKGVTKIDGYDPDEMYKRWKQCAETVGCKDDFDVNSASKRAAILKEVATRDPRWLYTGKKPKITFENDEVRRDKLKNHMDEIESCIRLRKHGIDTALAQDEVPYYDKKKGLMQTRSFADLKNGTELKVLVDTASKNTINGYLKSTSKRKQNANTIIFDNYNNAGLSDEDLVSMLKSLRSFSEGSVYVLTKDESLIRVR